MGAEFIRRWIYLRRDADGERLRIRRAHDYGQRMHTARGQAQLTVVRSMIPMSARRCSQSS